MTERLSDELLSALSVVLADQTGLHYSRDRWPDLERGVRSAARKLGCPDATSCARRLVSSPLSRNETEILASELTVGETYFFREKKSFEILSEQIMPELARLRRNTERRLRIWSAGCCTGEEPYSIAIALDRTLPDLRQWQITILGTDINPRFLQKASAGVYGEWSFRDSPPWLKPGYFRQIDAKHYEVLPSIRERVTFSYLNLAEEGFPSLATNTNAIDLIFCRNVLMYFSPEKAKLAVHNFHRCLVEDGLLLVSATETSSALFAQYGSVVLEGVTFYKKGAATSPTWTAPFPHISPVTGLDEPKEVVTVPFAVDLAPVPSVRLPEPGSERPVLNFVRNTYQEALALFDLGNYEAAARMLKSESDLSPESAALLARICANLGDLVQARSWVELAMKADKLNAGLHYLNAVILEEQGLTENALAALKRTLYLDPNFVLAHYSLGNSALRQKKLKEAGRHFANAHTLLKSCSPDELLPLSGGLIARRLQEMVESALVMKPTA